MTCATCHEHATASTTVADVVIPLCDRHAHETERWLIVNYAIAA